MFVYIFLGTSSLNILHNESYWLIDNGNGGFVGSLIKGNIFSFIPLTENLYLIYIFFILSIIFFILSLNLKSKEFILIISFPFRFIKKIFSITKKNNIENYASSIDITNKNIEEKTFKESQQTLPFSKIKEIRNTETSYKLPPINYLKKNSDLKNKKNLNNSEADKNSELRISLHHFGLNKKILGEIGALGFVTLARQAVVSLTYLLMNNILFKLGGESSVAVYAIIGRMLMFALFPVLGVTQGFLPIAGYNHGAGNPHRVRESINKAILYASILALFVFAIIMIFPKEIVSVFTQDKTILKETPGAMRWVFAAIPIIALQLIGSAYFQAIGKALPALLLTLTRQGFFFIPLILILPKYFGEFGVWISFPLADVISTIVTGFFLNREIRHHLKPEEMEEQASPQKF